MPATLILQTGGGSGLALFIQLGLFLGILYFLLIRPQRQEQKRHREMVASLRKGDRVSTAGGLVGDIAAIQDDLITLKSGEARVIVERAKIARRLNEPVAEA